MPRLLLVFLSLSLPVSCKNILKMMIMYGTLTGKPSKTLSLERDNCVSTCLNDKECIAAFWKPKDNCQTYRIVLGYQEPDQIISIKKLTASQQNIVAVKTFFPSGTCPNLNTVINGSVTINKRMNNLNLAYSWKKTETGWTMSQSSSVVFSRGANFHLCGKLYRSEQSNGGFTQPEASRYCGTVNRKLLGTTGSGELTFLRKSTPVSVDGFSFWLGGTSSNCVNGKCNVSFQNSDIILNLCYIQKITWSDGWSLTTVEVIKSTVANPCIAVVNGEMVGRSCNEKMKGALCGWKIT
ncbi:hypothetical protein CAEBREN_11567 [Caenorhabditis brenneri]|uniref:PAN-3 domain-containing protein n=1 Tax=Caenorhabditis brenneri TaxID=135651 RepID=G0PGW5_CAEBE|nr:hypothetical protein CAEBREN_11567 [Caenorhabditis brenneri]